MDELGIDGNDYENDTFAVRSYNWVDEDANDWHFWHKPSGLKIEWYKYPLRGFEVNMEITDDQFLDVLRDCTNSMEDGKAVRVLHDIRRWWADRKTEPNCSEIPNNCEDEPQTDNGIGCSRCEGRFDCYDRDMPHAVHCNNYGKITDETQSERSE